MRDGIIVQEQSCQRCAIRRTAKLASGQSFCFNCRLQWSTHDPQLPRVVELKSPGQVFAPAELARLAVYRAAVRDGFYSDWNATSTDGD